MRLRRQLLLTAILSTSSVAPLAAQTGYEPFGRDPSDPVSSFAIRDKAGNEQHHLVRPAPSPGRIEGERCLPKTRVCLSLNETSKEGLPLLRVRAFAMGGDGDKSFPLDIGSDLQEDFDLWSLAVRRAPIAGSDARGESVLVGVTVHQRLSYSAGAASRRTLWLFMVDNAGSNQATIREVLSVPLDAGQSIRACFNKKDEKARHNACVDETAVDAILVMNADDAEPMPTFTYRVRTSSYPSDMPFREPQDLPKKLTKKDLVSKEHPICTYERKVAWNPATARYEFDRPAPDCKIYGLERD